jgi:hypothetical protein
MAEARDSDHCAWNAWISGERQPGRSFEEQKCFCWNRTFGEPSEDWLYRHGWCSCGCSLCCTTRLKQEIRGISLSARDILKEAITRARQTPWPAAMYGHATGCGCGPCGLYDAEFAEVAWLRVTADEAEELVKAEEKEEHRIWLASPEGQSWQAQEEAKKQAKRAELAARERREAVEFDTFKRGIFERGPLFNAVRSSGDELTDLRALLAAASASDSRRGYGVTFLRHGQLVELRASACPLHQDEVLEDQRDDPSLPDWAYCTAACPVSAEPWPITTGKRIQALVDRLWASGLHVSRWVQTTKRYELFFQLRYAGCRWEEIPGFSHETYQLAAADALWPGVLPLLEVVRQPVLRSDGSVILEPGYDRLSGLWVQPASAPGRRAIGTSLAGQLLAVAGRHGRWFGSMSELAAEISWPRSARALTAALQDPVVQRELRSLDAAIYQEGWTSARVRGWVVTKKDISTPDTPELCR